MIIRLLLSSVLASLVVAQAQKGGAINPQLVGTWTTKSRVVFTGPGFYDPVKDKMTEPPLTGISYSFTADGHFEEAYYRTGDNAQNPKCPQGIIQWQHGTFTQNANGSLSLTPIAVDGRQQKSNPCAYQQSLYTRYHQTELFSKFDIGKDSYHGVQRLHLYQFDGTPMNPMYLAYTPPMMLPTVTLNPTASGGAAQPAATGGKQKRSAPQEPLLVSPPDSDFVRKIHRAAERTGIDADFVWWLGLGMTALGSLVYFLF